jgi:hypothetical protein
VEALFECGGFGLSLLFIMNERREKVPASFAGDSH